MDPEHLLTLTEKALAARKQRVTQRRWSSEQLTLNLAGESEWTEHVRQQLRGLAETRAAVFLHGERERPHLSGALPASDKQQ